VQVNLEHKTEDWNNDNSAAESRQCTEQASQDGTAKYGYRER
jgi:hypothetical protein